MLGDQRKHKTLISKKVSLFVLLFCCFFAAVANADMNQDPRTDAKVLVLYTTEGNVRSENVNLLDMLLGHFSKDITFKSASDFGQRDLDGVSVLVYYGEVADLLPDSIAGSVDSFKGTTLAIGHNAEQLGKQLSFFKQERQVAIEELVLVKGGHRSMFEEKRLVSTIDPTDDSIALINGTSSGNVYPIFIKNKSAYYYAPDQMDSLFSIYLGEALHDVFQADHAEGHPAYLRLEDIHPLTDASIFREIATILKKKNIPYIVSVIPVYRDPKTGVESRFSDYPHMLSALKYSQQNGGSIIMHGYTHQYKDDETGEGFEFWDVDANMPVTVPPDQTPEKKNREDFKSEEEYLKFLGKQKAFETDYIKTKVTKAIQEMVGLGLYPLAFEAPHYTMSQSGFEILSDHFSTYIGQLQLGDRDWQIMAPSPYLSYPAFLHGMKLLPETIGFVEPDNDKAIDEMMKAAENQLIVRDGYVAGFYHPYLGVERFKELIERWEKIPNLQWIDLKKMNNYVAVDNISVIASEKEEVTKSVAYFELLKKNPEYYNPHVKSAANYTMWMIVAIAGVMVAIFVFLAIKVQVRRARHGGDHHG
ncbi:MAG: polysaccharide deacetylase family protein [Mesobacillus sp.]